MAEPRIFSMCGANSIAWAAPDVVIVALTRFRRRAQSFLNERLALKALGLVQAGSVTVSPDHLRFSTNVVPGHFGIRREAFRWQT
jgi:hypothetical protein